jgi:quercetin dioxygenase-like cupin family protein
MNPVLYGPGEGEHHDAGAAQIVIKAAGEHTGGAFFLTESTLAPGFAGPPPHRHRQLHDMFYVLEGTLTLRLGDRTVEAGPGSFACVPPGVVHTFRNDSDGPVRLLNFNTPGSRPIAWCRTRSDGISEDAIENEALWFVLRVSAGAARGFGRRDFGVWRWFRPPRRP